jgi:hypothetical protein
VKLRYLAHGLPATAAVRHRQDAIIAALSRLSPAWADGARIRFAEASFNAGDYAAARQIYAAVGDTRHALKARQMIDWIDYKHGIVERGWPAYPGADFHPKPGPAGPPPEGPVAVANPNKPQELVSNLGLAEWTEANRDPRPVLVWFNFKASLGGEILAAKVVRAFQRRVPISLILAVDPRLVDIVGRNFPGTPVISREGDLGALRGRCSAYLLARDTLRRVITTEADFPALADEVFTVTPAALPESTRPRVGFTWKTTNPGQGLYRNIPLDEFASLLAGFDLEYHSAQHGVRPAERAALVDKLGPRIRFDTIDPSASVGELAAGLRAMDAVVTIDNSVLHIAGAFDVATFGLLSVPAYWAWPLSGPSSRWYRSVTLFHQRRPRQWRDVLDELAAALSSLERRPPRGHFD